MRRFTDAIAAADAVCVVTPEYNRSIPAVLKNAIDWGSKPADRNVWRDKVVAMAGASPGKIGTAVAQQHLRQILSVLGAVVVPGETYISFSPADLIDDEGNVSDDGVRDFIAAFAGASLPWWSAWRTEFSMKFGQRRDSCRFPIQRDCESQQM